MIKKKTQFACQSCGSVASRWQGQCPDCQEWNTLTEVVLVGRQGSHSKKHSGYAGDAGSRVQTMIEVSAEEYPRLNSGMQELDRVLGGGIVPGAVVLVGGDPGVGKSTLLLQTLCHLSRSIKSLYITGEESLQQVVSRARRLGLYEDKLRLLAETEVETMLHHAEREKPDIMVVDSIQTVFSSEIPGAPGGVTQVRECAARLTRLAKTTGTTIFLVGHVTKTGEVAGPRVLEHIVDSVIFLEGRNDSRFRILRAIKNRFGAVNELGVFAMTEQGMREINNPSAIFLTRSQEAASGSVVMVVWEGSRPLLVEIQALVDGSHAPNPRRVTVGLEQNRMAMLLAVLSRHAGVITYDQDVFLNVVGGVRVTETSADMACLLAIYSSLRNQPLPPDLIVFGEVGLAGEIRPVTNGPERLKEAAKHGFKRAIVPHSNRLKPVSGIEIKAAKTLSEALALVQEL